MQAVVLQFLMEVYVLSKIRIKFIRGEEVKYVSHLDIMKVFERAARRARLPLAYSKGFNPHPQIIFGLPLSVGVTSEAEFADFEIDGEIQIEKFKTSLNGELPGGFTVLNAAGLYTKDNIMVSISTASYKVLFLCSASLENVQGSVESLKNKQTVTVKKFSKKGMRDFDIRPLIYKLDVYKYNYEAVGCDNSWLAEYIENNIDDYIYNTGFHREDLYCLDMQVSAGNVSNLNPSLVMTALSETCGLLLRQVKIHRTGLFLGDTSGLIEPMSESVLKTYEVKM